ncbi:MAG: MFS transporter [Solirubrobacteraceae bacterium]
MPAAAIDRWSRAIRSGPPGGRDSSLLLAARVLMSAQRALIGVVVPIYLARGGFSATELGAMFSLVALASAALSAGIGFAADRVGRKVFVVCVPLLSAVAGVVFSFTDVTAALFAAAAVGSFGRGSGAGGGQIGPYQPAEQALMADKVSTEGARNKLFGLIASASATGGLLGSVLAITPLTSPTHHAVDAATYRPVFLTATLLAVLAAACALPVREAMPKHAERRDAVPARRWRLRGRQRPDGASTPRLSPASARLIRRLWMTNGVNGAAVGLFGPFITYWLYRRYGAGPAEIGTLYTIANLITIATNQLAAPLAGRHGTVRTVVVIRAAQALLLPALALMPAFAAAGAVYTCRLAIQRIGMALRQSFVMGAAPPAERARVGAFSQLPTQGLSALSPTLSGYLFAEVSLAAPFALAGVLQLINAILFHHFFAAMDTGEAPSGRDTEPERVPGR